MPTSRKLVVFGSLILFSLSLDCLLVQGSSSMRGTLQSILEPRADVKLSVPVEGIVSRYYIQEGDEVKKDQALLELNSNEERLRVKQAEGALISAKAELERAEKSLDRIIKLTDISSEKDLEQAEFDAANAKGRFAQAEATYEISKAELEKKIIRSPIDGIFLRKYKMPGEAVNKLEVIGRILDVSQLEMVVLADSAFWGKYKKGDSVPIEITNGPSSGKIFEGEVAFVDSIIDPASGGFRIKILIEPTEEIVVGLSCRIPAE